MAEKPKKAKKAKKSKVVKRDVGTRVLGEQIKTLMNEYKIKSESLEKVISSKHNS